MYMGASTEATPMATPHQNRAAINCHTLEGMAQPSAAAPNNTATASSALRRPHQSPNMPAHAEPRMHPHRRLPATSSVWISVKRNCSRMKSSAPLMTAVSKPNSSPEIAAALAAM